MKIIIKREGREMISKNIDKEVFNNLRVLLLYWTLHHIALKKKV